MGSRDVGARPPERLIGGRYRVEEELGRGASAIVHRAFDTRLHRPVALKRMREDAWGPRVEQYFLEEARSLASLRHPNLLEVYDVGVDEGTPYVASRLLVGETMERALSHPPVRPEAALRWCLPILGALAVAHDHGIVHRDVKPSNIFLEGADREQSIPILLDFGIARRLDRPLEETTSGVAVGTPGYMAPEVISGDAPSAPSDLWSMGVVLYRLLSAKHPFGDRGSLATLAAVVREAPTPLLESAPHIPRALALAIDRALRPRASRYRDAREFARALLEAAVAGGVALPRDPDPNGLPKWEQWLASAASSESTARVIAHESTERAPTPPLAIESARFGTVRRPSRAVLRLIALAVAVGGASWAVIDARFEEEREGTSSVESGPAPTPPIDAPPASAPIPEWTSALEPRIPEREASERVPSDDEPQPPAAARTSPRTRSAARGAPRQPARHATESEPVPPALPAIVRSWEL